ncbi:hypothetical protein EON73_00465 [bacterium]|nr:MAG: hypothetical protein EON73_00465 [bacterium]
MLKIKLFCQSFFKILISRWVHHTERSATYTDIFRSKFITSCLFIIKKIPFSVAARYLIHRWTGSAYYRNPFFVVFYPLSFAEAPLHSVGYVTWLRKWRANYYPWLVKKFPTWGHWTSLFVWWIHLIVENRRGTSHKLLGWLLFEKSLLFRYFISNQVYKNKTDLKSLNPSYFYNPLEEEKQSLLLDKEWLSSEGAFSPLGMEPFQDINEETFNSQQDDSPNEEEDPNTDWDYLLGTQTFNYLEEEDSFFFSMRLRYKDQEIEPKRFRLHQPIRESYYPHEKEKVKEFEILQDYHRGNSEAVSFELGRKSKKRMKEKEHDLERFLTSGDGPNVEDHEFGLEWRMPNGIEDILDWYSEHRKNFSLTSRPLILTVWSHLFRIAHKTYPRNFLFNPKQFFNSTKKYNITLENPIVYRRQIMYNNQYPQYSRGTPERARKTHYFNFFFKHFARTQRIEKRNETIREPWVTNSSPEVPGWASFLRRGFRRSGAHLRARKKNLELKLSFVLDSFDTVSSFSFMKKEDNPRLVSYCRIRDKKNLKKIMRRKRYSRLIFPKYRPLYSSSRILTGLIKQSSPNSSLQTSLYPAKTSPFFWSVLLLELVYAYWCFYLNSVGILDPEKYDSRLAHPDNYPGHVYWVAYNIPFDKQFLTSTKHMFPSIFEVNRENLPRSWLRPAGNPGIDFNYSSYHYYHQFFFPQTDSMHIHSRGQPVYYSVFFVWKVYHDPLRGAPSWWEPFGDYAAMTRWEPTMMRFQRNNFDYIIPHYLPPYNHAFQEGSTRVTNPPYFPTMEDPDPKYRSTEHRYYIARKLPKVLFSLMWNQWLETNFDDYLVSMLMVHIQNSYTALSTAPFWVNSRYQNSPVNDLQVFYLTRWETLAKNLQWTSDFYSTLFQGGTQGKTDELFAFDTRTLRRSLGSQYSNIPLSWEIKFNQQLILDWRSQNLAYEKKNMTDTSYNSGEEDQFHRDLRFLKSFVEEKCQKLFFNQYVKKILRIWFYFMGSYGFFFCFRYRWFNSLLYFAQNNELSSVTPKKRIELFSSEQIQKTSTEAALSTESELAHSCCCSFSFLL